MQIYLWIWKEKNNLKINKFFFNIDSDFIKIKDLEFIGDNLLSFKEIDVKTNNNEFNIKKEIKLLLRKEI